MTSKTKMAPGLLNRWKQGDRPALMVAGFLGAVFYFFRFGFGFLNPGRVDWLLGMADTAFNQLAWTFFRYDSWHWPPGVVKTFMAPGGTTIGVADTLPLLAFPFKMISFLLPDTFQYAGLWLLTNHVLMAVFAVCLTGLFFRPLLPRFLAAGVLVLCPAWLIRDGHFALSAHWVYLAALWLYLKEGSGRPYIRWWILAAVAALIHPYPAVFTLCFLAADQARRWWITHEVSPVSAVISVGGGVAIVVTLWYLAGFLRIGHLPVGNLTEDALWSASFHALWDSQGRAFLLPALPLGNHEPFEGFVYLGAGGLLAVLASVVFGGGRKIGSRLVRHWPLALILMLCALYAYGPRTDLGDQLFRAQARFLWPHFYVLVAAGLMALARWNRPRWPVVIVAVMFVVQVIDLAPLFDRKTEYDAKSFTSRMQDPQWARAMAGADLLLTLPASTATTVFEDDFVDLTVMAHEFDVPTTAGFATRNYLGDIKAAEELARDFLFSNHPDPRTVGVVRRSHFAEMFPDFSSDLRCTDLDGFPVCFARDGGFRPDREYRVEAVGLADFLSAHMDKTLILVGKADVRGVLTRDAVELLAGLGSRIAQLPVGASYASIIVHGGLVFERMHPENAIEVTGERNSGMGPVRMVKEMNITSSGTGTGKYASVKVDGREILFNRDGLNIAVIDDRQEVLAVATFGDLGSLSGLAATAGGLVFTLVKVD
ncbi:MAG: hypothetical protein KAH56_14165 [Candidatus Krumholzibacteria bacterium]|nr:hypothetical protein [Candidatus Krumholzibacteria bacterium]